MRDILFVIAATSVIIINFGEDSWSINWSINQKVL